MNEGYLYIKPNEWINEALKDVVIPISTVKDFTGVETKSLLILIDDGPSDSKFQTFGYYITDWNHSATLVNELKKVKKKYNISERTISYKGRKDKLKRKAFSEWINVVKNYPGLLYVIGFETAAKSTSQYRKDYEELKASLTEHGFEASFDVYEKMASAISFFTVIAPYFYEGLNIAWLTDPDTIIDTKQKANILNNSVGFMLDELISFKLGNISCFTKFNENQGTLEQIKENEKFNKEIEELLSIPDIVCSSISASINLTEDNEILCPDEETSEIITELAQFVDIEDYKTEEKLYCLFGFSLFELEFDNDGNPFYRHKKIKYEKTKPNKT